MNAPHIMNAATDWARLKSELIEMFGGGDDRALCDSVDGMSDFRELIIATMRSRDDDDMLIAGLKARIEDLKDRLARFENRSEAKRQLVEAALIRADIRQPMHFPDFTLSLGKRSPKVIISDETLIPGDYYKTPEPKLSKELVRADLDLGVIVPGAALSNGGMGMNVRKR